jgi:hypothetical protein
MILNVVSVYHFQTVIDEFSESGNIGTSIGCPDPGSGAFLSLDLGSGIGFFRIPNPGSRIPNPKPIFLRA